MPSGWKADREDLVGVPAQHLARAAVDLPQADGAVLTARGEPAAVGTEGGLADAPLVAAESGGRLVRLAHPGGARSSHPQPGRPASGRRGCRPGPSLRPRTAARRTRRRRRAGRWTLALRWYAVAATRRPVRTDGHGAECSGAGPRSPCGRGPSPRPRSAAGHPRSSRSPATSRRGRRPGPARRPGWGKVAHGSPVAASHRRTVLSQPPEAIQRPSGLKATG